MVAMSPHPALLREVVEVPTVGQEGPGPRRRAPGETGVTPIAGTPRPFHVPVDYFTFGNNSRATRMSIDLLDSIESDAANCPIAICLLPARNTSPTLRSDPGFGSHM